jgi:nitrogen fixation protein FixH
MNSSSALRTPHSALRTRWNPWPVSIIAFFTVALIGCVTFVAYCNRHPADLIAADYYEQEVRYQGHIERMQHTQGAAQAATVSYDQATRQIKIALPATQAHTGTVGQIQLYRPSELNQDRQIKFQPDINGVQAINAADLLPGLWVVRVSWTVDKQDYYVDQRIIIGS